DFPGGISNLQPAKLRMIDLQKDIALPEKNFGPVFTGLMSERNTRPLSFARGEDFLLDLTPASDTIVSMKTAPKARRGRLFGLRGFTL
ncbi:unnamed protein product, partial [marine sediment metagenome]